VHAQVNARGGIPRSARFTVIVGCVVATFSSGLLAQGGGASSAAPGSPPPGQPYFEFQVTKPVSEAQGTGRPAYPADLKSRGITGVVTAQFVVDTSGRAEEATLKILTASHGLFADAVREALPRMLFNPAELRGTKVRQLVQQPFVFAIAGQPAPEVPVPASRQYPNPMAGGTPAPAPPSGRVPGWSLTTRTTVDSGSGRPPRVTIMRLSGSGSKLRQEIESAGAVRPGALSIMDTSTHTMTMIMPERRSAMIARMPKVSLPTPKMTVSDVTVRADTIAGSERLLGLSTTHVRLTTQSTTTETLGAYTCTARANRTSEMWMVNDTSIAAIQRLMAEKFAGVLGDSFESLRRVGRSNATPPKFSIVRSILGGGNDGSPKYTTEVLEFTLGPVDASLFAVPEGFTIRDMSAMQMPEVPGMSAIAERQFWQRNDTTRVGPDGSRATCRRAP
jgi:TonB family protein